MKILPPARATDRIRLTGPKTKFFVQTRRSTGVARLFLRGNAGRAPRINSPLTHRPAFEF